jgi:polynucleotide 5'-kinase involved in rRNA processing
MDFSKIYEKLGLFYIGSEIDIKSKEPTGELMLVKNKNLTTHAAIIGMTGSGKTGLGISLIEEAVLDKIPSIIIDPKGDMGNLSWHLMILILRSSRHGSMRVKLRKKG